MSEGTLGPTRRYVCKYCAKKIDVPISTWPAPVQDPRTGHFCVWEKDQGQEIKPIRARRKNGDIGADPDIREFLEMRTSILDPDRRRKP